jgi:DNA-binding transcriptional ArsR family regulator
MYVVDQNTKLGLPTKEITSLRCSGLATRILFLLAKRPSYAKEIAQRLNVHEQKVYYHIRNLEKSGMIKIVRKEERGGAIAKFYGLSKPSFFIKFNELEKIEKIPAANEWLEPFVMDGHLDARIVVGSPDPHGPERARSRDAYYAIDLGLFLGTFITSSRPSVCLDVDVDDYTKDNLIVIGGPIINRTTKKINDKLPIRFDERKNIFSSITKKTYRHDECGIIVKMPNPHNKNKQILVIAGKRYSGTRAAILALLKRFDEVTKGNKFRRGADARVVEGLDMDGDGIVDDVKILE